MNPTTAAEPHPNRMVAAGLRFAHRIGDEVVSVAPTFLFFLIGFLLVLLVIKLFLAQYAIGFSAFPEAVVGALLAAKAVLVLDHRDYARLRRFPRAYAVVSKTAIYVLVVMVFGVAERILHGYRETGSFADGLAFFVHRLNRDRFIGTILCVAIVFGAYFVIREIEREHGRGSTYELFFRSPLRRARSDQGTEDRRSAVG